MTHRKTPRTYRRLVLGVVAAILGTILAGALLEALARLGPAPRYHAEPLELDPVLGFRGEAGHHQSAQDDRGPFEIRFDAEGFRGSGLPRGPAPPDEHRIAFLGDSFLVGLVLREEDLVAARVERALRARTAGSGDAGHVRVLNLGIVDTGTAQQILLLRALADRIDPGVVVLFLYPPNDVINNWPGLAGRSRVSPGDYLRPYLIRRDDGALQPRFLHPLRATLRSRSALFALVEQRLLALGRGYGLTALSPWPPPADAHERLEAGRAPLEWMELLRPPAPASEWARAWRHTLELIRVVRRTVEERGARLVVIVIPHRAQVERTGRILALDLTTRHVTGRPLASLVDWDRPEEELESFLESEGIESRLLLGPLREAAREGRATYTRDGHLSSEGHAIAAAAVLDALAAAPSGVQLDSASRLRSVAGKGQREDAAEDTPPPVDAPGPVDVLPPSDRLDGPVSFEAAPHEPMLGRGWGRWQRAEAEQPGGWWLLGRGLLALPIRDSRLTLRGIRPDGEAGPVELRIALPGRAPTSVRLPRPGPFGIHSEVPAAEALPTVDGYVPIVLEAVGVDGSSTPVLIREAGFGRTRGD